jgi:hypothetical protein
MVGILTLESFLRGFSRVLTKKKHSVINDVR